MPASPLTRRAKRFRAVCILVTTSVLCGLAASPALAAGTQPARAARPAAAQASKPQPYQSPQQASAQAARTGKAVPVTGSTTPTSTLTANPDGSYTLTESGAPVRTQVNGTWRTLDADLARNPDGTYSPAVSTNKLVLSGGGTAPLATMTYGSYSLSMSAPMSLPAPTIAGASATYASVLPGVDLIVTAQPSGGYDEVLRVDSRAAAASPALASLTFATRATGLTLSGGGTGSLVARDSRGQAIFAAPPARMWDSAVSPRLTAAAASGQAASPDPAGTPARSSAQAPAAGAHTGRLRMTLAGGGVTLTPDHSLLTAASAVFPEYIDPDWSSAGSSASAWAYVSSDFPSQQYYDTKSYLQVGLDPDTGGTSYSFYKLAVPATIRGSYISSATAYFPEVWADSCTASPVDLYQVGAFTTSTTYNNQPSWGTRLGSDNVAYGWSPQGIGGTSSCPAGANDVPFSVASVITADAATTSGAMPDLNVGLKAESASAVGWKQFANAASPIDATASMTIKFAFAPSVPTLHTTPAANCRTGTSILGNGNVVLDADVYDKDGDGLSVTYAAYANGNPSETFASNPTMTVSANSGHTAALELHMADLANAANHLGSGGVVPITWTATVSNGLAGMPTATATCTFKFSTAIPGAPDIADPSGHECSTTSNSTALPYTGVVGTPATFTVTANPSSVATTPVAYNYQLNGGDPVTVTAGTNSPYGGTIQLAPTRQVNILTVTATGPTTTIGQVATCYFLATEPSPAADQDLTGDGIPDLLTVGDGTTGTASGLWLAAGRLAKQADGSSRFGGTVSTAATEIGPFGPQGLGSPGSGGNPGNPASWNHMKAITGEFLDSSFNDIEAYTPGQPDVYLLPTQGDGSAPSDVQAFTSQDQDLLGRLQDVNATSGHTDYPMQLVNAYDAYVAGVNAAGGSAAPSAYPDQIGLFTDSSAGSYLAYFVNNNGVNSFGDTVSGLPYELTNPTPDGTMDWANWTITTDSDTRGATTDIDMYLWNRATGALDLWELTGLTGQTPGGTIVITDPEGNFSVSTTNPTAFLQHSTTVLSAGWNTNASLASLQATDVNGEPGLTDVTAMGQAQSWAWNGTSLTQANATDASQKLTTADHTYAFDDSADDGAAVSVAADVPGIGDAEYDLASRGTAGAVTWNAGDMFSPDADFNDGSSGGYLVTTPTAGDFSPTSPYTISAWVKLAALGGTVFSQNGTSYSTVMVSSTTSGTWSMSVNTSGSSYQTNGAGTARVGLWTNLVLAYDGSGSGQDGIMRLYANGTEIGSLADTSPPAITGPFRVGASQSAGNPASFLAGQVADLQVWHAVETPALTPGPASAYIPLSTPARIMDTRSASQVGAVTGPVAAGAIVSVPIAGITTAAGITIPSTGVTAVAIAISVTGQSGAGYITVYPHGESRPDASTVNFASTGTISNNAVVPLGPDGRIAYYNYGAADQVLLDVDGYFTANTAASGAGTYHPLAAATRIIDTSTGTGFTPSGTAVSTVAANTALDVKLTAHTVNGVTIPNNATALVLNVSAVAPSGDSGFITAYPGGIGRTSTSQLQFSAGTTTQGTIIIPIGAPGTIELYNGSAQPIDMKGDLSGWFATDTTGQYYHSLNTTRVIDTRQSTAIAASGSLGVPTPASILVANPTLVLNLTSATSAAAGSLKANPSGHNGNGAGILDFASGQIVAGLAITSTATSNAITIGNVSAGATNVIIDSDGYFD
jgi:hypothetical protein